MTAKIYHPLLAMIASATNNELAKCVEYLKEENKILRARVAASDCPASYSRGASPLEGRQM
jgi:hypothetical protein